MNIEKIKKSQPLNQLRLTRTESDILKGIALLFLLIHHLFYIRNGRFDDIELFNNHYLINIIGQTFKVCVPLFVFLSGYGLTAGVETIEKINLKKFYKHRFSKLYFNYWLIWMIFVPIGIFVFDITFEKIYGNHIIIKFILDILGLINIIGNYGYNPTWWFYSCITLLYILFPITITACKNKWSSLALLLISVGLTFCQFTPLQPIRYYLLTFILGCYFRNGLIYKILPPPISHYTLKASNGQLSFWEISILIIMIGISIPIRFLTSYALVIDTLIAILIIFCFKNIKMHPYIHKSLRFCGKHSFNIFLFHTFLFYLYLPLFIYWHRNPLIIFITLLLFCLSISVIIEYGKDKLGYYKFLNRITN